MFKSLLTAAMAVMAVAIPVQAGGLHDFDASVDVPNVSANKQGDCYSTKDQSRVCYMRNTDGSYSLAIYDTDAPDYPIALNINCKTGNYRGYGTASNQQMKVWATVFCRDL